MGLVVGYIFYSDSYIAHVLSFMNFYYKTDTDDQLGPSFVAHFSNRGPTSDGRSKPDILAPGKYLLSSGARPNQVGECDSPLSPSAGYQSCGLLSSEGTSTVRIFLMKNAML